MNTISQILGPPSADRGDIAVFPRWALLRDKLADLPADEGFDLYACATNVHDYWWPLVRGAAVGGAAVVFDDTRGVTAARLSAFFGKVTAVFDQDADAELLLRNAALHPNLTVVVDSRPWQWAGLPQGTVDLFVWQRATRHLQRMGFGERRREVARLRAQLARGGAMVVDDNLTEPRFMSWLSDERPQLAGPDNLGLLTLRSLAPSSLTFVGARPLRRSNWPVAEVTRRRTVTLLGAAVEGVAFRELNSRTARRYVVPRKAVAVVQRSDSLMARVLAQPAVRRMVGGTPRVRKLFAGTGEVTIALIGRAFGRRPCVAMRFGYGKRAIAGIERARRALEYLGRGALASFAPVMLAAENFETGAYTAETHLAGTAINDLPSGDAKDTALVNAAATLGAYQAPLAARRMVDRECYDALLGGAFAGIRDLAPQDRRTALPAVEQAIADALLNQAWPLHPCHGDFKGGNVLVGDDSSVTGIIDWDMWTERGLPLLDVLALAAFDWSVESGKGFGPALLDDLLHGTWRPLYEQLIETEAERMGLAPQEVRILRAAFWIRHLSDRIAPVLQLNRQFAAQWVEEPLRQIERYLAA